MKDPQSRQRPEQRGDVVSDSRRRRHAADPHSRRVRPAGAQSRESSPPHGRRLARTDTQEADGNAAQTEEWVSASPG